MSTLIKSFSCTVSCAICLTLASFVYAQVEVRESSPVKPSVEADQVVQPENNNFIYELQILRQEILSLRGILEEQAYEIKRLKQQRLDDYLDLDNRITELVKTNNSAAVAVDGVDPPSVVNIDTGLPKDPVVESEEEKALYSQAIDRLLNQQDYDGAEADFDLSLYSTGQYVPNVFYWQGQIALTKGKEEIAASTFEKLVKQYPTSPKASDAKFKLARIYFNQGKRKESRAILDEVAASNTEASPLAKSFIQRNF